MVRRKDYAHDLQAVGMRYSYGGPTDLGGEREALGNRSTASCQLANWHRGLGNTRVGVHQIIETSRQENRSEWGTERISVFREVGLKK